eukprot:1147345-Pelagomonas_calceolata.AAC.6
MRSLGESPELCQFGRHMLNQHNAGVLVSTVLVSTMLVYVCVCARVCVCVYVCKARPRCQERAEQMCASVALNHHQHGMHDVLWWEK